MTLRCDLTMEGNDTLKVEITSYSTGYSVRNGRHCLYHVTAKYSFSTFFSDENILECKHGVPNVSNILKLNPEEKC